MTQNIFVHTGILVDGTGGILKYPRKISEDYPRTLPGGPSPPSMVPMGVSETD